MMGFKTMVEHIFETMIKKRMNTQTNILCDEGDRTLNLPPILRGCTLSGGTLSKPLVFGNSSLISVTGNPTYWHYGIEELPTTNLSDASMLGGKITLVPVGNALGDFKCTEIHELSAKDIKQTASTNIYSVADRVVKEFCSNVKGVKQNDEISIHNAILTCPRTIDTCQ